MTPTNRNQSAHTYFGYPQLQWAEQHQATIRQIVAEERLAHDARPAQPSWLMRIAALLATVRGWMVAVTTGSEQPKVVR